MAIPKSSSIFVYQYTILKDYSTAVPNTNKMAVFQKGVGYKAGVNYWLGSKVLPNGTVLISTASGGILVPSSYLGRLPSRVRTSSADGGDEFQKMQSMMGAKGTGIINVEGLQGANPNEFALYADSSITDITNQIIALNTQINSWQTQVGTLQQNINLANSVIGEWNGSKLSWGGGSYGSNQNITTADAINTGNIKAGDYVTKAHSQLSLWTSQLATLNGQITTANNSISNLKNQLQATAATDPTIIAAQGQAAAQVAQVQAQASSSTTTIVIVGVVAALAIIGFLFFRRSSSPAKS